MKTNHTQGPWTSQISGSEKGELHQLLIGQRASRVGVVILPFITLSYESSKNAVLTPQTADEAQANARLIAAAPEMLEALEAVNAIEDGRTQFLAFELVAKAIAKARGEK